MYLVVMPVQQVASFREEVYTFTKGEQQAVCSIMVDICRQASAALVGGEASDCLAFPVTSRSAESVQASSCSGKAVAQISGKGEDACCERAGVMHPRSCIAPLTVARCIACPDAVLLTTLGSLSYSACHSSCRAVPEAA